jgi:glutaredoxin
MLDLDGKPVRGQSVRPMLDQVREALYRAITSPRGDFLLPVRVQKDLARRLNLVLGSPLAPKDELQKRREALSRLASLRSARGSGGLPVAAPGSNGVAHTSGAAEAKAEQAPVMVYFEKDRNARELARLEETLAAKQITYKLLDVAGDEAALDFVMREAHCEQDDLPIVFVAGSAIGGFRKLVEADVSGELQKALYA